MRLLVVALLVSSLVPAVAAAQAPGQTLSWDAEQPAPPTTTTTIKVSYRKEVLVVDGLSIAAMTLGPAITRDADIAAMGLSGYFLGAPIVHLAHGRGGAAAKSFALRAGLPLLGGMIGYKLGPDDTACVGSGGRDIDTTDHAHGCGGGSIAGMLIGVLGGGVAAIYIDSRYLATYEKAATQTWSAGVRKTDGGALVSVAGAF
jgi:hypothetical protein